MIGWLIVLGVVILILLLLQIRLKLIFSSNGEGVFRLLVGLGPMKMRILPAQPKAAKAEKPEEGKKEKEEKRPGTERSAMDLIHLMTDLVPKVARAAGRLIRKIRVDRLDVHVVWGNPDPASAAIGYGGVAAAMSVFWGCVDHGFRVIRHSLSVDVDFQLQKPALYSDIKLTLTLAQLFCFGISLGVQSLPGLIRYLKKGDRRDKNTYRKAEELT